MRVLAVAPCVVLLWAVSALGQRLPAEVERTLARNAERVNPISIHTLERFECTGDRAETLRTLGLSPAAEQRFFAVVNRYLRWQAGHAYLSWQVKLPGGIETTEQSFDGFAWYDSHPDLSTPLESRHPLISRHAIDRLPYDAQPLDLEYFERTGIVLPSRAGDLREGKGARSTVLALLEHGTLRAVEETTDGSIVRVTIAISNSLRDNALNTDLTEMARTIAGGQNTEEAIQRSIQNVTRSRELPDTILRTFDLARAHGYAVTRIEDRYPDGRRLCETQNDRFEEVNERGLWLPRVSRTLFFTHPLTPGVFHEPPILSRTIVVTGPIELGPIPDDTFQLVNTDPGTIVIDDALLEREVMYTVPAGADQLARAMQTALPRPGGSAAVSPNAHSSSGFLSQARSVELGTAGGPHEVLAVTAADRRASSGPKWLVVALSALAAGLLVIVLRRAWARTTLGATRG